MPKSKKPPEKPEDQFKRFLETAKAKEVSEEDADTAFRHLSSAARQPGRSAPQPSRKSDK
jgi:hypothetical protein